MEAMSQRQFAEHIGRSHVWVNKLVKQGKLPVDDEGKIPLAAGMAAYNASQQVGYDSQRQANERQRKTPVAKKPVAKPVKASSKKKDEPRFTLPEDDEPLPTTGNISVDKVAAAFNKARLAEKTYQAKLKELDFKEKQGLLLPKESVEADAANTAEELRGLLYAIPPRIAPLCEGKAAREIEGLIEGALNQALASLKKSRFTTG